MACHGPRNSKVAELRSCNQGFHNVGIGSLLAIFVSHALLSIFLSFSRRFSENSLQRGAYRWLQKKKRKKEKRRDGYSSHSTRISWTAKKLSLLLLTLFFSIKRIHTSPHFLRFNDGTVYWCFPRYFGDNYRIRWMDLILIFFLTIFNFKARRFVYFLTFHIRRCYI